MNSSSQSNFSLLFFFFFQSLFRGFAVRKRMVKELRADFELLVQSVERLDVQNTQIEWNSEWLCKPRFSSLSSAPMTFDRPSPPPPPPSSQLVELVGAQSPNSAAALFDLEQKASGESWFQLVQKESLIKRLEILELELKWTEEAIRSRVEVWRSFALFFFSCILWLFCW
jgi:hypothetical protein